MAAKRRRAAGRKSRAAGTRKKTSANKRTSSTRRSVVAKPKSKAVAKPKSKAVAKPKSKAVAKPKSKAVAKPKERTRKPRGLKATKPIPLPQLARAIKAETKRLERLEELAAARAKIDAQIRRMPKVRPEVKARNREAAQEIDRRRREEAEDLAAVAAAAALRKPPPEVHGQARQAWRRAFATRDASATNTKKGPRDAAKETQKRTTLEKNLRLQFKGRKGVRDTVRKLMTEYDRRRDMRRDRVAIHRHEVLQTLRFDLAGVDRNRDPAEWDHRLRHLRQKMSEQDVDFTRFVKRVMRYEGLTFAQARDEWFSPKVRGRRK